MSLSGCRCVLTINPVLPSVRLQHIHFTLLTIQECDSPCTLCMGYIHCLVIALSCCSLQFQPRVSQMGCLSAKAGPAGAGSALKVAIHAGITA